MGNLSLSFVGGFTGYGVTGHACCASRVVLVGSRVPRVGTGLVRPSGEGTPSGERFIKTIERSP